MHTHTLKCHIPHRTAGSSLSTTSRRKLRSPSLCSAAPQKKTLKNHFRLPLALTPGFLSLTKFRTESPTSWLVLDHSTRPAYEGCTLYDVYDASECGQPHIKEVTRSGNVENGMLSFREKLPYLVYQHLILDKHSVV